MNSKTARKIRQITKNIPKELMDSLMIEQDVAPTVIEVAKKALKDPDINDATKKRLKLVLDSGMLDRKEMVADHEVEKKIDAWIDKQITDAVKRGDIPDPKTDKDMQDYRKKVKKVTKWKNKNTESSSAKTSKDK